MTILTKDTVHGMCFTAERPLARSCRQNLVTVQLEIRRMSPADKAQRSSGQLHCPSSVEENWGLADKFDFSLKNTGRSLLEFVR